MNEEQNNLTNSVEPTTPVQPVETPAAAPVPPMVETPAPVAESAPVAPEAPVVEPAPAVTPEVAPAPEVKKKGMNPIILVLLILALIGGVVYGLYTYTDILPVGKKASSNDTTTTTTTTTTAVAKELYFKSFEEYTTFMSGKAESKDIFFDITGDFTKLDFDLANQCKADGQDVSLTIGSYTAAYKCKLEQEDNPIAEGPVYSAEVTVNDTAKLSVLSFTECSRGEYYTNGKYIVSVKSSECSVGFGTVNVADMTGKVVIEDTNIVSYYQKDSADTGIRLALTNNNSTLYFLSAASEEEGASTCTLKYIDLSKDTLTVADSTVSEACYSTGSGV